MTTGEIARRLDRIESKVDAILADHETRLRRVEKWLYALPATALAAVASLLAALAQWAGAR